MFVQVQVPVWDPRKVTVEAGGVLKAPGWPLPVPGRSFLHGVGGVVRRPLGGISGWVGEDVFCNLAARLRVPKRATRDLGAIKAVPVRHVFSRFYFDGTLSGKIDLGFVLPNSVVTSVVRLRSDRWGPDEPGRNAANLGALLRTIADAGVSLLDTPARLRTGAGEGPRGPLAMLLRLVLHRLVYASTHAGARNALDGAVKHLAMGPPNVCIECSGALAGELTAATAQRGTGESFELAKSRVALAYAKRGPDECPLWVLYAENPFASRADVRLLRIALLRLSSDLYCLRKLIQLLGRDKLDLDPRGDEAQVLQEYVRQLCRRLRSDLKAIHRTEAADVAQPIFRTLFQAGAVEAAFSRLETLDARPNVRALLKSTIETLIERGAQTSITLGPGAVYVAGRVAGSVTTNVEIHPS